MDDYSAPELTYRNINDFVVSVIHRSRKVKAMRTEKLKKKIKQHFRLDMRRRENKYIVKYLLYDSTFDDGMMLKDRETISADRRRIRDRSRRSGRSGSPPKQSSKKRPKRKKIKDIAEETAHDHPSDDTHEQNYKIVRRAKGPPKRPNLKRSSSASSPQMSKVLKTKDSNIILPNSSLDPLTSGNASGEPVAIPHKQVKDGVHDKVQIKDEDNEKDDRQKPEPKTKRSKTNETSDSEEETIPNDPSDDIRKSPRFQTTDQEPNEDGAEQSELDDLQDEINNCETPDQEQNNDDAEQSELDEMQEELNRYHIEDQQLKENDTEESELGEMHEGTSGYVSTHQEVTNSTDRSELDEILDELNKYNNAQKQLNDLVNDELKGYENAYQDLNIRPQDDETAQSDLEDQVQDEMTVESAHQGIYNLTLGELKGDETACQETSDQIQDGVNGFEAHHDELYHEEQDEINSPENSREDMNDEERDEINAPENSREDLNDEEYPGEISGYEDAQEEELNGREQDEEDVYEITQEAPQTTNKVTPLTPPQGDSDESESKDKPRKKRKKRNSNQNNGIASNTDPPTLDELKAFVISAINNEPPARVVRKSKLQKKMQSYFRYDYGIARNKAMLDHLGRSKHTYFSEGIILREQENALDSSSDDD